MLELVPVYVNVEPQYMDTTQILIAAIISLVSLQLYVRYSPFMDDDVDSISTIAQLMTFTQLFLALLMSAGLIANMGVSDGFSAVALGSMSVVTVGFSLLARIGPIAYAAFLAAKPFILELWEPTLEALAGLGLVCLVSSKSKKEDEEGKEEEEEDDGALGSKHTEKVKHHRRATKVLAKPATRGRLDPNSDDYETLLNWVHFLAENNHVDFRSAKSASGKTLGVYSLSDFQPRAKNLGVYSDPAFEETLAARREELIEKSKGVYGIQKELGDGVECGTDEVPLGWGMTFPHDEPITEPEEDVDADKSGNVVLRF